MSLQNNPAADAVPGTTLLPPVFRRLAGANLGAQAAEQISLAAVPIVAVLALNAGPGEIGLLAAAQSLPFSISSTTLRQTVTPAALLGRVTALFLTANMGARPVGAALGAAVGAWAGEAACLWLALAGFVVQAGVIWASAVRPLRVLPATANA